MTTKRKFHSIKLSYTIDNVTITRAISELLFNEAFNQACKDPSFSEYEALVHVIYELVSNLAEGAYVQFIECELVDDMGYKVKIVR